MQPLPQGKFFRAGPHAGRQGDRLLTIPVTGEEDMLLPAHAETRVFRQ
jgi:hypothetical protein